jgi:uncharacterized protein (DUF983 family)
MDEPAQVPPGQMPVAQAAFLGCCPRCGNATLFAGMTRFADHCRACGLDFRQFNVGDGPAAFLILIVGGVITALALTLQLKAEPPFWVHILLWADRGCGGRVPAGVQGGPPHPRISQPGARGPDRPGAG